MINYKGKTYKIWGSQEDINVKHPHNPILYLSDGNNYLKLKNGKLTDLIKNKNEDDTFVWDMERAVITNEKEYEACLKTYDLYTQIQMLKEEKNKKYFEYEEGFYVLENNHIRQIDVDELPDGDYPEYVQELIKQEKKGLEYKAIILSKLTQAEKETIGDFCVSYHDEEEIGIRFASPMCDYDKIEQEFDNMSIDLVGSYIPEKLPNPENLTFPLDNLESFNLMSALSYCWSEAEDQLVNGETIYTLIDDDGFLNID